MAPHAFRCKLKRDVLLLVVVVLTVSVFSRQIAFASPESRENSVVRAVRRAAPAVVNISSQYEIRKNSNLFSGYGMNPVLEKFFREFFAPELERREERTSLGSGVIIDGNRGFVLTNTHVVENAATITVMLNDEREFAATIIGMDPESDLAVLAIQTDQALPSIQMGTSDDIMIGESVIAIGNPFGFSHTVTTGVVSAVDRSIKTDARVYRAFIQTDASINPGNSGGPLLNIDGALIGINTAIYADAQGIGFAIPINRARRIVSDLLKYGEVVPPWIGLSVQAIDQALSDYLKIGVQTGVIVTGVEPKSPADEAGFREGDLVQSINDYRISDIAEYHAAVGELSVGQAVMIGIHRTQTAMTLSLKTVAFPVEQALDLAFRRLGIRVAERDQPDRGGVVIVEIHRGALLYRMGVRPGDIIHQLDAFRVTSLSDFKTAVVKCRKKPAVVMLVERDGALYHIHVNMKDE